MCAYRVPRSKENYLVAIYSISKDPNYKDKAIDLELTGPDPSGPTGFFGLKLGDMAAHVEVVLGKPTKVSHEDDANLDLWRFETNNYSLEFTPDHKLYSIQVVDEAENDTSEPAGSAEVRIFAQAIQLRDIDKVMEMVSGEIVCSRPNIYFDLQSGSARNVLSNPKSDISVCLERAAQAILALGPQMQGADDEIRVRTKYSPRTVTKFPVSSPLEEIVFVQEAGAFRVYEVTFR